MPHHVLKSYFPIFAITALNLCFFACAEPVFSISVYRNVICEDSDEFWDCFDGDFPGPSCTYDKLETHEQQLYHDTCVEYGEDAINIACSTDHEFGGDPAEGRREFYHLEASVWTKGCQEATSYGEYENIDCYVDEFPYCQGCLTDYESASNRTLIIQCERGTQTSDAEKMEIVGIVLGVFCGVCCCFYCYYCCRSSDSGPYSGWIRGQWDSLDGTPTTTSKVYTTEAPKDAQTAMELEQRGWKPGNAGGNHVSNQQALGL